MERCADHDKLAEVVIRMEEKLDHAIKEVTAHISAGSKWRLAIACSCVGLVGLAVGAIVRFAVVDFKVANHDVEIKEMRTQIYDLNYEKGRAVGLAEKNANTK